MADKLVIGEGHKVPYIIYWQIRADGSDDIGAVLGEESSLTIIGYKNSLLKANINKDEREHMIASVAAMDTEGYQCSPEGFYWETKKEAQVALRYINLRLKSDREDRPWPEWAIQAKTAGWTPPKNWKP